MWSIHSALLRNILGYVIHHNKTYFVVILLIYKSFTKNVPVSRETGSKLWIFILNSDK